MGRWEPDARGRLARGGDGAVRRARLRADHRRRHRRARRADRADVLPLLRRQARGAVRRLRARWSGCGRARSTPRPADAPPIEAVAAAPRRGGRRCSASDRDFSRQRQAVIAANAELQERELIKLAALVRRAGRRRCAAAASPSRPRASPPRPASPSSAWRSSAGWPTRRPLARGHHARLVRAAQRRHRRRADAHRVQRPCPTLYRWTVDTVSAWLVWSVMPRRRDRRMGMSDRDERERREKKDGISRRDFLDGAAVSAAGLAAAAAFPGLTGAEAMAHDARGRSAAAARLLPADVQRPVHRPAAPGDQPHDQDRRPAAVEAVADPLHQGRPRAMPRGSRTRARSTTA